MYADLLHKSKQKTKKPSLLAFTSKENTMRVNNKKKKKKSTI